MIGDVLLIEEKHTNAAIQLAAIIKERNFEKTVIAIAGESGTGKSEIAHELRRILKEEGNLVNILHSDNYYKILPTERTEWRKKHGIKSVGEDEYNWAILMKNIEDFRNGRKAILPYYDLYTNQKNQLITNFKNLNILIVEGLYSLRSKADLKVFINFSYTDNIKAQVLRKKEPQTTFRTEVLQREKQVIQSHKSLADYFINRDYDVIEQNR